MDQSAGCVIHAVHKKKQETIVYADTTPATINRTDLAMKVRLLDQFCRLCLRQSPDMVPLFSRIGDMSVSDVFGEITGLEMTLEDTYPHKTCRTCVAMLNNAFVIRQNFIKSYQILNSFALSKSEPLINHLANYQRDVRATSEMPVEKMLQEYQGVHKTTAPKLQQCIIPQPDENSIELPIQVKQEPELILESEELPYSSMTVAESKTDNVEQLYASFYCDAKLETGSQLTRHERCNTNERPNQCLHCPNSNKTGLMLNEDTSKIHTKSEQVNDGVIRTCKFEGCDFSTTNKRNYYHHKANHELKFQCTQCSQRFPSGQQLQRHQHVHTGVKLFQCEQCDKSFQWKVSLREHVAVHNNDRPYACETCGMTFVRKTNLKNHLFKHSAQPSFECRYCDKKFKHFGSHLRHERVHMEAANKLIDPKTDGTEETTVKTEPMDSTVLTSSV